MDEILSLYRSLLKDVCTYNAEIMRMSEKARLGVSFDRSRFAYAALQFRDERQAFLELKEYLGYPGGADFLTEDTAFMSFTCQKGKLSGKCDKDTVYRETENFISGFPEDFNVHNFEVATMVRALSDAGLVDDLSLYPEGLAA